MRVPLAKLFAVALPIVVASITVVGGGVALSGKPAVAVTVPPNLPPKLQPTPRPGPSVSSTPYVPSATPTPTPTSTPIPATIANVGIYPVGVFGNYRPESQDNSFHYLYTNERLLVSVSDQNDFEIINGQAVDPPRPAGCLYEITVKDLDTGTIALNDYTVETFGTHNYSTLKPGLYSIEAVGRASSDVPSCRGDAKTTFRVLETRGWITDMELRGFTFHFQGGDMALPQFCSLCGPLTDHTRNFVGVLPTAVGSTAPRDRCGYHITAARGSDVRGGEGQFINGQPGTPVAFSAFTSRQPTSPPLGNPQNPYWYMYNDDVENVTVTISTSQSTDLPPCYIYGGKITKSITVTTNEYEFIVDDVPGGKIP